MSRLKIWSCLLLAGIVFWLGATNFKPAVTLAENVEILHVLDRLSFGATFEDIETVKSQGIEAYIESQLYPETITESATLQEELTKKEMLNLSIAEILQKYSPAATRDKDPESQRRKKLRPKIRRQAIEANLSRAIASNRQLQEVMTHFWFNHFNVYGRKTIADLWVGDYENDIRTHALGNFRDLLGVTAHHPAMLIYLDNEMNSARRNDNSGRVRGGLNENYARELMELHTLGVDGGYTQADVIALAKIFTGWGIDRSGLGGDENGFKFFPKRHDESDKVFLGRAIASNGMAEGELALDMLAAHPATARHLSYKLAQYFVADEPPASLVDKLATEFLATKGDIRAVLTTLFHSSEFKDPQYYNNKFKTPYQYLISLVRAGGIENPEIKRLHGMLVQLGMPVYGCVSPDGYQNIQEAWLNPDAMMRRLSFATAIANGFLNKNQPIDNQKLAAALGNNFSPQTKAALENSNPKLKTALMLGSPEMMHR